MSNPAIAQGSEHPFGPAATDHHPRPGCVVGAYVLDDLLGKGRMGEVYRARDQRLGRNVAIKFVVPEQAADAGAAECLANEARVNSALTHPGIVTVYDIGRFRGRPFIVMELVAGESLAARLARGSLGVREALRLAAQIAEALAAAHDAGVVHRDLKPQNIMLTRHGRAKIVDFGLSMLQRGRRCAEPNGPARAVRLPLQGTVGYMAPEQAAGLPPDMRADQFALGAILYEMVSGRPALALPAEIQTLSDIIDLEPLPLEQVCRAAPPALVAIVNRCLQRDPQNRYDATFDLVAALKAAANEVMPPFSWRRWCSVFLRVGL